MCLFFFFFFFSSRRRHTRWNCDWSSDVCSSDLFSRFLLGIGEAGNWPAGVKVVAEWFPERERALASGIFNSGSSVGAILAPPVVAWIILNSGWRAAFLLVGFCGIVWLLVWWPTYRVPEAAADEV